MPNPNEGALLKLAAAGATGVRPTPKAKVVAGVVGTGLVVVG
jgi:hypothetical protein